MKRILFTLLLMQSVFISAQTETFLTPNGKKVTINTNPLITADNGLTNTNGNVQLGGNLINPTTTITTSPANTLAIQGLQAGSQTDQLVTIDNNGILRKISNNNWSTIGNTGTSTASNFLGTIDNVDIVFKRNNLKGGLLGSVNTSFGYKSLSSSSPGSYNTALGIEVLSINTGSYNIGLGFQALPVNTTGSSNIAMGFQSLGRNTTGSSNISLGQYTLSKNTTGFSNVGIGEQALYANTTGWNNTGLGSSALYANLTGNYNVGLGNNAMNQLITGDNNVAIGYSSAYTISSIGYITKSNSSVFIGSETKAAADNQTNQVVIGYQAVGRGSNTVQIGNNAMTSIGGQVAWSNPSDIRLKKDIHDSSFGLNFITKLRPVTYYMKSGTTDLQSGFIAQEVESAANGIGYKFSGIVKPQSENEFYSLRYSEFVVPLVKAVQEQQKLIEDQQKQIQERDAKIAEFENRLLKLEQKVK